jgi:hypothetical protein
MRSRAPLALLLVLAPVGLGAAATAGAGCSGDDDASTTSSGPIGPTPCEVDAQCDDENPCNTDTCGEDKLCAHEALPDQTVDAVPGDCHRTVCTNGRAENEVDLGDVEDDGEDCTLDTCEDGQPVHLAKIEDHPCAVGQGTGECHAGKCVVPCTPADATYQCDDLNLCTNDACVPCSGELCDTGSWCEHAKLSNIPTPGASQTVGDCQEQRCVEGKDEAVPVPDDVPDDLDACTEDTCDGIIPINRNRDTGEACTESGALVCDDEDRCVPPCAVDDSCSFFLFVNYEGGTFTINVDVDVPGIVIGLVAYHSMQVTITGTHASNVEAVHYVGYDADGTTGVQGVSPELFTRDPNASIGECMDSQIGPCQIASSEAQYFRDMFGGELVYHRCQYNAFTGPITLSGEGTCMP